jgi:hypothetical protein
MVYMVLFPTFLYCFSVMASLRSEMTAYLVKERIIVAQDGSPAHLEDVEAAWRAQLDANRIIFMALFVGVMISSGYQWFQEVYLPFATGTPPASPPDWSNFRYHTDASAEPYKFTGTFVFSTICYIYMALALYVYLALLMYVFVVASSLRDVSLDSGLFRLIFHTEGISQRFYKLIRHIFFVTFLGLCAAYAMRLQSNYLGSAYENVALYMFSEFTGRPAGVAPPFLPSFSALTAFGEAIYTLLVAGFAMIFVWQASANSRNYYLAHIGDPDWRLLADLSIDEALIKKFESQKFSRVLRKKYAFMALSIILLCLAIGLPNKGTIFVFSVVFAVCAALFSGDDLVAPPPMRKTARDNPIDMSDGSRQAILEVLERHCARNRADFLTSNINNSIMPESYKVSIINKIREDERNLELFLDYVLKQGTTPSDSVSVIGRLLMTLIKSFGLLDACKISRVLSSEPKITYDDTTLQNLKENTCGQIETFVKAAKIISQEDVTYMNSVLAENAINREKPEAYFDELINSARLPQQFKYNGVGLFKSAASAADFTSWALNLDLNPARRNEYTIASILMPHLESIALEKAARIAKTLVTSEYVREEDAERLGTLYGFGIEGGRALNGV